MTTEQWSDQVERTLEVGGYAVARIALRVWMHDLKEFSAYVRRVHSVRPDDKRLGIDCFNTVEEGAGTLPSMIRNLAHYADVPVPLLEAHLDQALAAYRRGVARRIDEERAALPLLGPRAVIRQ